MRVRNLLSVNNFRIVLIPFQPDMGVQILIELIDDNYSNGPDQLIDRFAINVSIPVGTVNRTTYHGIFGFAMVDTTFRLVCAENFYGPNCDICVEVECGDITMQQADRTIIIVMIVIIAIVIISSFVIIIVVSVIILAVKFKSKKGDKNTPIRPNLGCHETLELTRNAAYRSQSDAESSIASPRASLETFNLTSNITNQSQSNFLGAADSPRASLSQNAIQGSSNGTTNVHELDDSNAYELDNYYVQPGNKEVEVNNLLMKLGITSIDNDSVQ